jgi:hypothetical protein
LRPPYKASWVEASLSPIRNYLEKHALPEADVNDIHLNVSIRNIGALDLLNLFLNYEELNIKSFSVLR